MADQSSILDTFFEECEDLLEALSEGLAAMSSGAHSPETINAVFRAVHSIKGGAGAFGLTDLVDFSHRTETVLDNIRSDKQEITHDLLEVLHRASDKLAYLLEAARDSTDVDQAGLQAVLNDLQAYLEDEKAAPPQEFFFQPQILSFDETPPPTSCQFEIFFRPHRALLANGHEPAFLLMALADLGEVDVRVDASALPDFGNLDPLEPYFSWEITLRTPKTDPVVREVFEFVEGLCDLTITEVGVEAPVAAPPPLPQPAADPSDLPAGDGEPSVTREAASPINAAAPDTKDTKSASAPRENAGPRPSLRVDLERVDKLINIVGELIINQAMISQRVDALDLRAGHEIINDLEEYKLLARDIQEGVMAIRAQSVKPLFQRMARIVREAADATGKRARLTMIGEGTEVDKTVIERLADPLTHMIRNAVDHGLESSDVRKEKGKDETGEIRLTATHRSGSVIIEIADDGAGLNRPKILEIATSKGLVSPNAELTDAEIDTLLFMPGFSTAKEVSSLSGRGVGMDVVKTAVQALGGRVSISSVPGRGSVFTIQLPLTLAVMDGIVVHVAGQTMVVPVTSILETARPNATDIQELGSEGFVLAVRGRYVPIFDVAYNLGLSGSHKNFSESVMLLVETEKFGQCALAIDGIQDQRQVVIKSIESNYSSITGVSAATILGDGKIALILDPDGIAESRVPTPLHSFSNDVQMEVLNA